VKVRVGVGRGVVEGSAVPVAVGLTVGGSVGVHVAVAVGDLVSKAVMLRLGVLVIAPVGPGVWAYVAEEMGVGSDTAGALLVVTGASNTYCQTPSTVPTHRVAGSGGSSASDNTVKLPSPLFSAIHRAPPSSVQCTPPY
jgi:hypothetical protein